METKDAERVAILSEELGYPATTSEIARRLERIRRSAEGQPAEILVAEETGSREVVGWVHVCIPAMLVSEGTADIWGLVVDSSYRGGGVGRALIAAAETWAADHGCGELRLRSSTYRKEAHAFYQRLGYEVSKTQYTFTRQLVKVENTTGNDQ